MWGLWGHILVVRPPILTLFHSSPCTPKDCTYCWLIAFLFIAVSFHLYCWYHRNPTLSICVDWHCSQLLLWMFGIFRSRNSKPSSTWARGRKESPSSIPQNNFTSSLVLYSCTRPKDCIFLKVLCKYKHSQWSVSHIMVENNIHGKIF